MISKKDYDDSLARRAKYIEKNVSKGLSEKEQYILSRIEEDIETFENSIYGEIFGHLEKIIDKQEELATQIDKVLQIVEK